MWPGDGGALGRARLCSRWRKIFRMAAGSVMKARIFISAPQCEQVQRVDIIDSVDELGPALGQSPSMGGGCAGSVLAVGW